jgi:hypothetical protein
MTSEELIKQFDLPSKKFPEPIKWQDGIGFSILKDRQGGYASLYKIGLNERTGGEERLLKNLWITATYGKKSDGGITIGSGDKGLMSPIDLEFHDQFFYNSQTKNFFHFCEEISPSKILENLEKVHLRPTRSIVGLPLRIRLFFWRKFLPGIIKIIDGFLIFLLELISGEKTKGEILKRFIETWHGENKANESIRQRNIPSTETNFEKPQTMTFFGYTATRWSVVFYCILQLGFYILNNLYWKIKNPTLSTLFTNTFLTLCYVVVSFAITESLVPKLLKRSIEKMPKIFTKVAFKRIKISI